MEGRKEYFIETQRCRIRELVIDDIPAQFKLYDSPHMTDYIEPLLSYEEEVEYLKRYIEKIYGEDGYGTWAVIEKKTGRLIGEAGLEHRIDINREKFPYDWMFDEKCSELGFCFAEDLWGQGYCSEVCKAILDYGTEVLEHTRFFARAARENAASVRVLEKLGFTHYEGNIYLREG